MKIQKELIILEVKEERANELYRGSRSTTVPFDEQFG